MSRSPPSTPQERMHVEARRPASADADIVYDPEDLNILIPRDDDAAFHGGRLSLGGIPTEDAALRVQEWAVAHGDAAFGGPLDVDAPPAPSAQSLRLSDEGDATRACMSRENAHGMQHSFDDLRSDSDRGVNAGMETHYAGEVHALEESRHEAALGLEVEHPCADGGAPPGTASEPTRAAGKMRPKPKVAPIMPARPWLRIGDNGELNKLTTSSKYKAASQLGVKPRDLRLLELPTLAFSPAALLARENAIVVCFESIRCIVTLNCVYVVNPEDERTHSLVEELNRQLRSHSTGVAGMGKKAAYSVSKLGDIAGKLRYGRGVFGLPFELKALEICFDRLASELNSAAGDLERDALPALDKLTKTVGIHELETVRRIKNRLVRLKTRVESIHEVFERFLNDDEDMHRLNLTAEELSRQASEAEAEQRSRWQSAQMSVRESETAAAGRPNDLPGADGSTKHSPGPAALLSSGTSLSGRRRNRRRSPGGLASTLEEEGEGEDKDADVEGRSKGSSRLMERALTGSSMSSHTSSSKSSQEEAEIAEVEMLLEAYDMHLEHALARLQTLDEYIQDTEDLVNTALDQKRNEIISCDVLLTTNIVAFGLMSTISSFFAMNTVPVSLAEDPHAFSQIAAVSTVGVYVLWLVLLLWLTREGLVRF